MSWNVRWKKDSRATALRSAKRTCRVSERHWRKSCRQKAATDACAQLPVPPWPVEVEASTVEEYTHPGLLHPAMESRKRNNGGKGTNEQKFERGRQIVLHQPPPGDAYQRHVNEEHPIRRLGYVLDPGRLAVEPALRAAEEQADHRPGARAVREHRRKVKLEVRAARGVVDGTGPHRERKQQSRDQSGIRNPAR